MRRSMLFIPGNTPNLLMNGDVLGADSIILDLEDAVSPAEKDSARILVRNALKSLHYKGCEIIIRINPVETDYWMKDLDEIIPLKPNMIMPPKVSGAQDVKTVSEYIAKLEEKCGFEKNTVKLIPLIETAMGVENAFQIASADERVAAMFLGGEDLTADLRCKRTKDASFAKSLGFSGKASISPRHVEGINEVFSPTQAEIDYAHEVMETIRIAKEQGKGVVSLRGKMIDAPIVERARQVIEMEKAMFGEVEDDE